MSDTTNPTMGTAKDKNMVVAYMLSNCGEYYATVRDTEGNLITEGYWRTGDFEQLKKHIEVQLGDVCN